MPDMHLRQPWLTYSACGPFTKNKERIKTFNETGDSLYIYQNEPEKGCFQYDMAYGNFKDLARKSEIWRTSKGLSSMVYKFFYKKISGNCIKNKNILVQQLAEELHKPVIKIFKKWKLQSSFIDNIWGAYLAEMQLISKFNKRFGFLLFVNDIYSKYGW